MRSRHSDLQRHHGVASRDAAKLKRLAEFDDFVAVQLPPALRRAAPRHGNAALLIILVEWKLLRGKWRPALLDMAKAQTDAAVADAMGKALAALGTSPPSPSPSPSPAGPSPPAAKARAALDALCALRGVGPATASIVLCAATAGQYPYMGDEALEAALGTRGYTAGEYMALAAALQAKAGELRSLAAAAAAAVAAEGGGGGGGGGGGQGARAWTAEDVQRALHAAELEARAGPGGKGGMGAGARPSASAAASGAAGGPKGKAERREATAAAAAEVAPAKRPRRR